MMRSSTKSIESLQPIDFVTDHVWEYTNDDDSDETAIRPVERTPVDSLDGRIVGAKVKLANGTLVWAIIGNVDVRNPRTTEHFLTISIEHHGKWMTLARYHDIDYADHGPKALAAFLNATIEAVFPIFYDITEYANGDQASLSGMILERPNEILSPEEIIALAIS